MKKRSSPSSLAVAASDFHRSRRRIEACYAIRMSNSHNNNNFHRKKNMGSINTSFTRIWRTIISCLLLRASLQPAASSSSTSFKTNTHEIQQQHRHHHQRQRRLLQVRTANVDTTDLVCELGKPHSYPGAQIRSYEIPYYYALGLKTPPGENSMTFMEKHNLQQRLFASIRQQISWCYKEFDVALASEDNNNDNRQRQMLIDEVPENHERRRHRHRHRRRRRRRVLLDTARKLGILSVATGPATYDVGPCPDVDYINEKIESTGAESCQIVEGKFRVTAHDVDDIEYLTATLLDGMEEGMNLKEVWGDWVTPPAGTDHNNNNNNNSDLPDVAFLCYVGDTYAQAFYPPAPPPLIARSVDDNGGSGRGLVLLIGVGLPIATALALLALLVARKRRETATASQAFDIMNSDFVLVGMGDPPRSFHEGLYHYTFDGTRYLSTNCENCLETRRNSFYTDDNLGTIHEDEVYEDPKFDDLGSKSATMNVHKCKSTTCAGCSPRLARNKTDFVQSENPLFYPPTEHVEV